MRLGPVVALGAAVAALLTCEASAAEDAPARLLSEYVWPAAEHGFGGFSGLEVAADGVGFVAISDRGGIVRGRILREGERITGIAADPVEPLLDPKGNIQPEHVHDAEGLAVAPDGRLYVSYENVHRVWVYDGPNVVGDLTFDKAITAPLGLNAGFEALALDDAGRVYVVPEKSGTLTMPFPVYRHDDGAWHEMDGGIARSGGFLVTGADIGPDGRFYLLERGFSGFGFSTRVRRFDIAGDRLVHDTTLLVTRLGLHGNLEGLSVWRDAAGRLRLTMIADDNFRRVQRTEFVEYILTE